MYQLRQIRRVRKSLISAASKFLLVLASVHSRLDYCNCVLHSLPWSRLLAASVCVKFGSAIDSWPRAIWSPVLSNLHWLPYPQRISYRSVCLCSSVWQVWSLPIYLICVGTVAVPGRSGLRSAVRCELVPGHRTEWGSRSSAVAGWNILPVWLRDMSVGPETFFNIFDLHFVGLLDLKNSKNE